MLVPDTGYVLHAFHMAPDADPAGFAWQPFPLLSPTFPGQQHTQHAQIRHVHALALDLCPLQSDQRAANCNLNLHRPLIIPSAVIQNLSRCLYRLQ